ncbi:MAG: hypothetical protein MUC95_03570 [Spirochaetes bacterium]|nr:hypothetical protein [Spirochaetota bacterium]
MLYILWGFIIGFALNMLPLWVPSTAIGIFPEWHGGVNLTGNIDVSGNPALAKITLSPLRTPAGAVILSGNGSEIRNIVTGEYLLSLSGSGRFIAKYEKAGKEVEFLNAAGERFWKVKSNEYPYLSYNGAIVLFLNGDQSRIRILDYNGNEAGVKEISGRLCTTISFSGGSDFAGAGFVDGSYYILNRAGNIISKDNLKSESVIKGISISSSGDYAAVHYGNNSGDYIRLINIKENEHYAVPLKNVHRSRTALDVSNGGSVSVIDYDRILITDEEGAPETVINIPPKENGTSSMDCAGDVCAASYTGEDGVPRFLVFKNSGDILLAKEFPGEAFMESFINGRAVLVRGSQNLYCYSYFLPGL